MGWEGEGAGRGGEEVTGCRMCVPLSLCVYHVVSKQGNECAVEGVLRDWDHHSSALPLPSIHTGAQRQYGLHTRHSFDILPPGFNILPPAFDVQPPSFDILPPGYDIQPPGFDILPPCPFNMVKSAVHLVKYF